jgi:uncharacterized protein DUF4235
VSKILFIPLSVLSGLVAGFVGRRAFARVWGLLGKEEPPGPGQRDTSWPKLIAALALQGAIFAAVRGLFDYAARRVFARLTGTWPGEQRPALE